MNLKEYKVQPDEGIYEKIERRLRLRRWARVGGFCMTVAAVGVAVWAALPSKANEEVVAQAVGVPAAATTEMRPVEVQPMATVAVGPKEISQPKGSLGAEKTAAAVDKESQTVAAIQQPETGMPAPSRKELQPAAPSPAEILVQNAPEAQFVAEHPQAVVPEAPEAEAPVAVKAGDPSQTPVHTDNLIWAPTAIIPNGDVDENRTFGLKFSSSVTDFHIYIYNRGGRRVFMSADPSFVWDGTNHGTALPQGAYVWVARYRDTNGRLCQEKGTVTIVR